MAQATNKHWEQDKEATVYIGNLDERVSDAIIWELMLQVGRIQNVHLPKDRVTQTHQGYGFVEFMTEEDAEYAAKIMNGIRLYNKAVRVNKASADKAKSLDVGAELYVGNLDGMVDEKILYDTFSRFGTLINPPKIARDEANVSKGYGFISFGNFEASDEAIANMDGQFLANKEITVQYAFKKDGRGERHGDPAERLLAAQARQHNIEVPDQQPGIFPPQAPTGPMGGMGAPVTMPIQQSMPQMPGGGMGMPPPFAGYSGGPPQAPRPAPPLNQPLPPAPAGLPARPPPSLAGYGGPQMMPPPGFTPQQQMAPGLIPPGFPQPPQQPQMPPGYGYH